MIRASSLGTVLYPARLARQTLLKSRWTKANNLSSLPDGGGFPHENSRTSDDTSNVEKPSASSGESPPGAIRRRAHPAGHAPKPAGFQLPDPAPVRPVPRHFVRRTNQAYPAGRSWRKLPLPVIHPKVIKHGQAFLAGRGEAPFYDDAFDDLDLALLFDRERLVHQNVDRVAWRRDLLRILGNTQSHIQGWMAYQALRSVPFTIPHRHLKRLVRLISRETTKTHTLFQRLLSVLTLIHDSGWQVELYQWNALIDNAGKGSRKTRADDFKLAFDMFTDMVSSKPPGHALADEEGGYSFERAVTENPLPDIVSYTTLINHAANARNKGSLGQSTSLLTASRIPPNRITHLVLLKYYSNAKDLDGVRASLLRIRELGFDLGLDGLNACIWAFSHHHRLDVVMSIYRILRHNQVPETHVGVNDVHSVRRALLQEGIEINMNIIPNEVTYTTIVQVMAYHGHLKAALSAFRDMLSSDNIEIGASMYRDEHGKLKPSPYSPTLPIFRALFLGFQRHGEAPSRTKDSRPAQSQPWVLESLSALFEVFLALPEYIQPSTSTIYWTLVAFDKTSDGDQDLLRTVWTRIESHFVAANWGSEGHRLQRIRQSLFDPSSPEFNSRRSRH
ncbi:hypothetical protein B0H16DRAFT_626187 [Mycena metata]|uniref:Pentatricopeptide repeat protein n=1 Tax=Mycena metata TaxID=1033252 RepID=A0AAD7NZL4_9AGAR|nr:hypothetical protein B0H16DRAFT_626187 [Mycena metata]